MKKSISLSPSIFIIDQMNVIIYQLLIYSLLLDYKWEELEKSDNPFSIVVRIHLKAIETRKSHPKRCKFEKLPMLKR
ncbi:MAG: hypothetical protein DRQ49_01410 [Gammaproteobacteria bacterium]|nr:MAG: hypothetical protein DRQ49_01410 [Gammaproteobacteria bacterium]